MKYQFLQKTDGVSRLIIIMTGWSTGPALLQQLSVEGWDILVCHSYSDFKFPQEILKSYRTIYLFAWSLGVAAAEMAFADTKITAAYAVNGTPTPVHDELGIPTDIFIGTAVGLSEKSLAKFHRRMCVSGPEYLNSVPYLKTDDTITQLRNQLLLFAKTKFPEPKLPWRRVYMGARDAIFPEANMRKYWEAYANEYNVELIGLDNGHFVDLAKLVRGHIADLSKVARSFSASHDKYLSNAVAQRQIADRLAGMIPKISEPVDALEIGPGAGLFTRHIREKLDLRHLHMVDLYDISPGGYRSDETFVKGDAEQWIEEAEENWDIILSASSIQWFADLGRFFENVSTHLKPGGHLVCSTFLSGNLAQLDSLRPSPLLYLSRDKIEALLAPLFDGYEIEDEDITLTFDTPRKALLHLRDTGVAGVGASGKTVARIIKALTPEEGRKVQLTYRPVYIHAWLNEKPESE